MQKISFKIIPVGFFIFSLLVSTPMWAGDPFAGSAVYTEYCVNCHGGDGAGEIAGTPSFRGGRLMAKGDMELRERIRNGKDLMPSFRGVLSEEQIDDVVTYIRTFN